ncbi:MAG: succinylglutamate desuccinylase/aspartoacylase family protein [Lewinellaceae bacterium]|nr:succinylglutamate desuccinylase/aspartoacylase family protein [Lewinellaceae bacterium]
MIIHNTAILPGQQATIRIPVGQLPSGNKISIRAHVYRGPDPGPVMLALGGVHGDEINGVEILRRAIHLGYFEQIRRGAVIAIPLLNIYGFINYSRDVPDGKDVNRSFPGNAQGSLASRVARLLTRKILPNIDFGIDFHTGGRNHYNFPQIRFTKGDPKALELATQFGAPFSLSSKPISKSFRKAALDKGKTIIVFEGGENLRYDGVSISTALEGLNRVMAGQGLIDQDAPASRGRILPENEWIRAPKAGMFLWQKCSGQPIVKGEPLGLLNDPFGEEPSTRIYAPRDGFIIGHNNAPVVSPGDALYHIGYGDHDAPPATRRSRKK